MADLGGFAGVLDALIASGLVMPGHTLWVDYHWPRTSEALRKGVDTAIFVDARRLRRDLALWRLMPFAASRGINVLAQHAPRCTRSQTSLT